MRTYVGTVVDNKDPKQMGRVRVRVDTLHDETPDDMLPWATPKSQSSGNGSLDVPTIGKRLYVDYQGKEVHEPQYTGLAVDSQNIHPQFRENYPNRKGYFSEFGMIMWRDESNGTVHFESPLGVTVDITDDGRVLVNSATRIVCDVDGSYIRIEPDKIVADAPLTRFNQDVEILGNLTIRGDLTVDGSTDLQSTKINGTTQRND